MCKLILPARTPRLFAKKFDTLFEEGKITIDLAEEFLVNKNILLSALTTNFKRNIPNIYGLDNESVNKFFPNANVTASFVDEKIIQDIKKNIIGQNLSLGHGTIFSLTKPIDSTILECIAVKRESKPNFPKEIILEILRENILEAFFQLVLPKAFIIPVERNSIYTFSKELSLQRNILVDQILDLKTKEGRKKDPFDFVTRRATRYPLPVRDGLEIAEDLSNYKKSESEFYKFADELENTILGGKIVVSREGEVFFTSDKAKSTKLPIHLTASIVKSLSSLVLYFRHLAKNGDYIIIDEPELNLHPDSQILIARIIAKIVNKGFKVLINTHSDYIIRELNNLIMLNALESKSFDKIAKEYGYEIDNKLTPADVGAYLFDYCDKTKVTVQNLEVTEDGFEMKTIDSVINDLNERSQRLYFLLSGESDDIQA